MSKKRNTCEVLQLDPGVVKTITDVAKECLENSKIYTIEYTRFNITKDNHADFAIKSSISTTSGDCIYAIYVFDEDDKPHLKYIGASRKLTSRLNKHFLKNDDAFLDGTYVDKTRPYHSKISEVYNED